MVEKKLIEEFLRKDSWEMSLHEDYVALYTRVLEASPLSIFPLEKITLLGAGSTIMDIFTLFTLLHDENRKPKVDFTDISPRNINCAKKNWRGLVGGIQRRTTKASMLNVDVQFRKADATSPDNFSHENDLVVLRNSGGVDISTGREVDKQALLRTATIIAKPQGLICMTALLRDEIPIHRFLMEEAEQNGLLRVLVDQEDPISRPNRVPDKHLLVARKL